MGETDRMSPERRQVTKGQGWGKEQSFEMWCECGVFESFSASMKSVRVTSKTG